MSDLSLKEIKFEDVEDESDVMALHKEYGYMYVVRTGDCLWDGNGPVSYLRSDFTNFYEWPKNPKKS